MISQSSIEQIQNLPIVEIIGKYVQPTKGKYCCPIHNEKTPSLSVKQNFFKCFGCGAGGDGISFVQQVDNLDFIGAIEKIAQLFNISIEYDKNYDAEAIKEQRKERLSASTIMQYAHRYFVHQLEQNKEAKKYLIKERGYSQDTIDKWQLGYAPKNWTDLTRYYSAKGNLSLAIKLSLVRERDGKESLDFFIEKIMFPITDADGQLISFAGRVTDNSQPKYINGSQTSLYNKSATLFGLYQAIPSIKKLGYAILVEGYTDVISLHEAGATNAVGVCGSALTTDHVKALKKYTSSALLMPDNDNNPEQPEKANTGWDKVNDKLQLLLSEGMQVDIYALEDGQDPDNYAKTFFTNQ